jgi:hypothetical protein
MFFGGLGAKWWFLQERGCFLNERELTKQELMERVDRLEAGGFTNAEITEAARGCSNEDQRRLLYALMHRWDQELARHQAELDATLERFKEILRDCSDEEHERLRDAIRQHDLDGNTERLISEIDRLWEIRQDKRK